MAYVESFSPACEALFSNINKITTFFILPLFLVKVFYFSISGASPSEVGRLFKGVILYFLLISAYPQVLNIILYIPHAIQADSLNAHSNINKDLSTVPYALRKILESITVVLYHLGEGIFSFFLLVMSGIAPIVFLLGAILGIGLGITLFFSVLIMASTWPIIWYGLDSMFFSFSQGQSAIAVLTLDLLVSILKIVIPSAIGFMAIGSSPASFISSFSTSVGRYSMKFAGNKSKFVGKKIGSGLRNNNSIGSIKSNFFGKNKGQVTANSAGSTTNKATNKSKSITSSNNTRGHSSFYPNDQKLAYQNNNNSIEKSFASSSVNQSSMKQQSERSFANTSNSYHRNNYSKNEVNKRYSTTLGNSNKQKSPKKRNVFIDKEGGMN